MSFREIAAPLIERGVPVIPLRPRSKIAFHKEWPELASTDPYQIQLWDEEYPDANGGSVAIGKVGSVSFLEIDNPTITSKIEDETGQKMPETYVIRSSPGKFHFYFRQTEASVAMGNIRGTDEKGRESWSARVSNSYVVSPLSVHPITGLLYEVRNPAPILDWPDWLVNWCIKQRVDKSETVSEDIIIDGSRNVSLASRAGKMRNAGMSLEEMETVLLRMNRDNCKPPLHEDEVRTIAASISRYPVQKEVLLVHGSSQPQTTQTVSQLVTVQHQSAIQPYPRWPEWVQYGTSLYEGFVKPICDVNSRHEHFMFMPAVALFLNYIGTRVTVDYKPDKPNIFIVLIGRKGTVKSACIEDAIDYFQKMGYCDHGDGNMVNSEGKMLVWSPGSPEGFGIEMTRLNCKNGVMYYDELSTLTNKASIENSGLGNRILTLYESGKFQNIIKDKRYHFSLAPKTYCATLLTCSTDKNFQKDWSKINAGSSGLDDRMTFILQPEKQKEVKEYFQVDVSEGIFRTKQRIDKAIEQQRFRHTGSILGSMAKIMDNRAFHRVERLSLYFAIDCGKEEIGEEEHEKAYAVVQYEQAVKKYLRTFEGTTKEGILQQEIMHKIRQSPAGLTTRDLNRALHPERYGTSLWRTAMLGLMNMHWIVEIGTGTRDDPKRLISTVPVEDDDE